MANAPRSRTTTAPDISTVDGSKESADQESVPVPANTTEASVPEVEQAMAAGGSPESEQDVPANRWVQWKDAQHFEIRTITPQDWAKVGIENGRTVHWYAGNKFRVPLEDLLAFLNRGQLAQYVLSEPRFEIVED